MTTFSEEQDKSFSTFVLLSIALHIGVIAFFTVKAVFFPAENVPYLPAIRVDLVALPDKIEQPTEEPAKSEPAATPAPTAPPIKKEEVKPKVTEAPKVVLKKDSKAEQQRALEKLKAMEAIDKIIKEEQPKNKPKKVAYKGNVLSAGTELKGLDKMQHDDYLHNLDHHVKSYWVLPQWLAGTNLKAQVIVKIDERGYVISKVLKVSSGNSTYDDLVLETVQKASPFPAPPRKFTNIVSIDGIILGFPE